MTGLAEWLLTQISEDEIHAGIMVTGRREMRWQWSTHGYSGPPTVEIAGTGEARPPIVATVQGDRLHEHIARWDPARVLAECAAKRKIIEIHSDRYRSGCTGCGFGSDEEPMNTVDQCPTLHALAAPFADRPGFREEWRV